MCGFRAVATSEQLFKRCAKLCVLESTTSPRWWAVGLETTTYGETGVHRSPRVMPVAKCALPGSERASCGQLAMLRDSIVAA
jgi:hypothetical protein